MVDAAISESVFNMLEGCVPEFTEQGYDRPPSGSTISGASACPSGPVIHLQQHSPLYPSPSCCQHNVTPSTAVGKFGTMFRVTHS